MRRLVPGICLLFATACLAQSPTSPTPVDRQVVLSPGETTTVASGLSIRFVTVLGDSRCPADAMCVLGGDAIVRIDITAGSRSGQRDLHTGSMQPVSFEAVRIELVELSPYPFSARTIEPGEYRATLRITR